jgi:three-Cys-motif partner protein
MNVRKIAFLVSTLYSQLWRPARGGYGIEIIIYADKPHPMSSEFFEEQLPGSKIKSQIVASYFKQWAKIIGGIATPNFIVTKIGYIDLFCGPGKYEDGSDSTPLMILKEAVQDSRLRSILVTEFNDQDQNNIDKLQSEIDKIDGIDKLKYKPSLGNQTVGSEVVEEMKKMALIPSLIFIDPWGYKGLSLNLVGSVIKDWGCDCIFFFNYNRINAAVTNSFMEDHVNSLFGKDVADNLRQQVPALSPDQREELVVRTFMECLKTVKGQYSIKFKFLQEDGNKTSHFLILVSKNVLAYHVMKEIMAGNCPTDDGIPTYTYDPRQRGDIVHNSLFGDTMGPMADFRAELISYFKGRKLTVEQIYQEHNIGRPYIKANYKTALLRLENEGRISCDPPKRRQWKGNPTMGDKVIVTFNN